MTSSESRRLREPRRKAQPHRKKPRLPWEATHQIPRPTSLGSEALDASASVGRRNDCAFRALRRRNRSTKSGQVTTISRRSWHVCCPKITSRRRQPWLHAVRRIAWKKGRQIAANLTPSWLVISQDRSPAESSFEAVLVSGETPMITRASSRRRAPGSSRQHAEMSTRHSSLATRHFSLVRAVESKGPITSIAPFDPPRTVFKPFSYNALRRSTQKVICFACCICCVCPIYSWRIGETNVAILLADIQKAVPPTAADARVYASQ